MSRFIANAYLYLPVKQIKIRNKFLHSIFYTITLSLNSKNIYVTLCFVPYSATTNQITYLVVIVFAVSVTIESPS